MSLQKSGKAGRPPKNGEKKVSVTVRALLSDHERIKAIARGGDLGVARVVKETPVVHIGRDEMLSKYKKQNYELASRIAELEKLLEAAQAKESEAIGQVGGCDELVVQNRTLAARVVELESKVRQYEIMLNGS